MRHKVIKVGTSAAVIIPKKSLKQLDLKIGDVVDINIDYQHKKVTAEPAAKLTDEDKKVAKLTANFIKRYKKDLQKLGN